MAIKGGEYAVARIVATLQAFLATETALIDGEMADGITLDGIANYYDVDRNEGLIAEFPAVVVNHTATSPIYLKSTTNSPGVDHSEHTIVVSAHVKDTPNDDPSVMKKRVERYARAIVRVLAIKYPTLPSGGVETVVLVRRDGDALYAQTGQEPGNLVRSATIPFKVMTYENL